MYDREQRCSSCYKISMPSRSGGHHRAATRIRYDRSVIKFRAIKRQRLMVRAKAYFNLSTDSYVK